MPRRIPDPWLGGWVERRDFGPWHLVIWWPQQHGKQIGQLRLFHRAWMADFVAWWLRVMHGYVWK